MVPSVDVRAGAENVVQSAEKEQCGLLVSTRGILSFYPRSNCVIPPNGFLTLHTVSVDMTVLATLAYMSS